MKLTRSIALAALAATAFATSARADDVIRFGKAFPTLFQFTPVDLGIAKGFFKKRGLDVQIQNFFGDAKQQQAYAAGVLDMGIGSGAGMGFIAKGSPILAVAQAAGPPLGITLSVWADTPFKTVADLKGKTITGASVGDQTEWMVRQLSILQGWGPNGFNYVPLGASEAQIAALKTHQVAAAPLDITTAVTLESRGPGAHRGSLRQSDQKLYQPCDHRLQRDDRQAPGRREEIPRRLVRERRLPEDA